MDKDLEAKISLVQKRYFQGEFLKDILNDLKNNEGDNMNILVKKDRNTYFQHSLNLSNHSEKLKRLLTIKEVCKEKDNGAEVAAKTIEVIQECFGILENLRQEGINIGEMFKNHMENLLLDEVEVKNKLILINPDNKEDIEKLIENLKEEGYDPEELLINAIRNNKQEGQKAV
jgi:hypothetical protein